MTYKDLPGTEPDVTYAYDLLGRLTSASQPGQTLGFTYDALGRVLDQTGPLGTIASQWDLAGRRTRLTWPDGFYVTYDHLVTGETTHIRENGAGSGTGVIGTLAYDDLGRRTSLTLGNGVATFYAYDPLSRLGELKLDLAGTAEDLTSTFAYNPASQIASTTRSNDSYAWTGHGSGTTTATSNGIPQSANGLNQIGSWVSPLGYDAKGNVTTDGATTYTYSSENLLTSFTNPGSTAQTASTFAYDPLMRLAIIDSTNAGFDVQFGYDGQEMAYEGLSDSRTRRYVYGPGTDEPLVGYLITATGTSRLWYQADERGSILRLSNDAGTPGGIGKYDEYGAGGTSRFRYTGQYWLGEANLLYYRARVYDARLGRFLQPDPIGYGDGMNMYAYVGGDPVNSTDPTGTCSLLTYSMHYYNSSGDDIGEVPDSRWTELSADCYSSGGGAGGLFYTGGKGGVIGGEGGSSGNQDSGLFHLASSPDCPKYLIKPCAIYRLLSPQTLDAIAKKHFGQPHLGKSVFRPEWQSVKGMSILYRYAMTVGVPQPDWRTRGVYILSVTAPQPIGWERYSGRPTHNVTFMLYQSGVSVDGKPIYQPSNAFPGLP
jgi:RHS repeat-associated protein